MENMTAKEAALNSASLTYAQSKDIGYDACDSWIATIAMIGLCDPRIIAGYNCECENIFSSLFAN